MDQSEYRKRIHQYYLSMSIFLKLYEEGIMNDIDYELMETMMTRKYSIHPDSIFRLKMKKHKRCW